MTRHPLSRALLLAGLLGLNGLVQAADLLDNGDLAGSTLVFERFPAELAVALPAGARAQVVQLGDGNQAGISQQGNRLLGAIVQQGSDHEAFILQQGEDQLAIIQQDGHGNLAGISQQGSDNRAAIIQHGHYNEASISQQGSGLRSTVIQHGSGQHIEIVQ